MRVLVVGLNYAPEKVGIAVYTTGLAEALVAAGHQVEVIAGQPYYPRWQIEPGYSNWRWTRGVENDVVVHRVPHYIPRRPTGTRRVLHHVSFAFASLVPALRTAMSQRPELVLVVAPSLISAPIGLLAARIAGARSWLHVQDLEVDAALGMGLISNRSLPSRVALGFEAFVLKAFDRVSALTDEMRSRIIDKGVEAGRVTILRNWADPSIAPTMSGVDELRRHLEITTPHVALYSGNIANKQGIDIVIDAARLLADRPDLTFLICGEGPNLAALMQRAAGLNNLRFAPLQPKERLPALLSLANVHLLPQLPAAASVVMPSKLTNMLASGRPVVATAMPGTALAREVEGCGIVTPPEDAEAFASAIAKLCADEALHSQLGAAALRRARDVWSAPSIISGFIAEITRLCRISGARSA